MREVYKALQRPEQVRKSAFDFVAKHIPSRRYLAVHWRFEGSLMEGGKTQSICKTKTNVRCQKIMNLYASPDLIVRKIRRQLALWQLNVSFFDSPNFPDPRIFRFLKFFDFSSKCKIFQDLK